VKRLQVGIRKHNAGEWIEGGNTLRDTTAPVVTVGVYYKIGFRLEPQRAQRIPHLFEHMMFQGSANAPKMQTSS